MEPMVFHDIVANTSAENSMTITVNTDLNLVLRITRIKKKKTKYPNSTESKSKQIPPVIATNLEQFTERSMC